MWDLFCKNEGGKQEVEMAVLGMRFTECVKEKEAMIFVIDENQWGINYVFIVIFWRRFSFDKAN